jgi:hypothetical protein
MYVHKRNILAMQQNINIVMAMKSRQNVCGQKKKKRRERERTNLLWAKKYG